MYLHRSGATHRSELEYNNYIERLRRPHERASQPLFLPNYVVNAHVHTYMAILWIMMIVILKVNK